MLILLHRIRRLIGNRILLVFAINVPLGVLLGIAEIGLGFTLQYFLSSYGLVLPSTTNNALATFLNAIHPTVALLLVGSARTLLIFASVTLGYVALDAYMSKVRSGLSSILAGSPGFNQKLSVAEVSIILSDVGPKSAAFVSAAFQSMTVLLSLTITLIGLTRLSLPLSGIALGALFLFGFPTLLTRQLFQKYSANVYRHIGAFNTRVLKDFRNWDFLKVIGRTTQEQAQLASIDRQIHRNNVAYVFWSTGNAIWPQLAALLVISSVVIANQKFAYAESAVMIPFIYLLIRIATNMGNMATTIGSMQFNAPFVASLTALLFGDEADPRSATPPAKRMTLDAPKNLAVQNLSIGRTSTLLRGINFTGNQGDFICFTGESGRGKTTLLMTLIGVVPPLEGSINWNNVSVGQIDLGNFRQHVAYSGPDPFLLDMSIRDNILLGNEDLGIEDKEIEALLPILGCDFVLDLPQRLNHHLQEGGEGISAGQKQRLSILRAVIRKPKILLLDEATANIDTELEAKIITEVKRLLPQTIILAVSHRSSVFPFATSVINL